MPKFCKDCEHCVGSHTCNRPIDLGVDVVTGNDQTAFVAGWDCRFERAGGVGQIHGQDVELCGPDAQFFVERTTPLPEPTSEDLMPEVIKRQMSTP